MWEREAVPESKPLASGRGADTVPAPNVRPAFTSPHLPGVPVVAAFRQSDIVSPSVRHGYVLQLQQRYGNRYVQRIVESVVGREVKREIDPVAASGPALQYDAGQRPKFLTGAESVLADARSKASAACETFPGGSTECEIDEGTGTPTGKVTHHVDETNPCTAPAWKSMRPFT